MKAKLLIVTTLFNYEGTNVAVSSVIAEFDSTSQADSACNVIEARGNSGITDSTVQVMKLY